MPTYQEFLADLNGTIEKVNESVTQTFADVGEEHRKTQDQINASIINTNDKIFEKSTKVTEANNKANEKSAEKQSKILSAAVSAISSSMSGITEQFRSLLVEYTNQQQKLSYSLINSGMTYDTVRNALSVLGTNAFIRQQDVYSKLTNLVSSGITMNAAQRAYLETAADQVGLQFSTNTDTLNRLIQIYETDISESRLAQMAGLRDFLEQNYKNSQYIYNGFNQVSDALLQMQSWMETGMAMATEKTIQGYLGAFASAGGSNVSGLAAALNQIGSGDFNLDSGMQNLMVMAASRAGLSYADILTGGLNANSSDALLNAMFSYIASMGGTGSNVATNAMARLFGVSMSDIRAAQGMARRGVSTDYSSDIGNFFASLEESTNNSTKLATWWNNAISNQALTTPLGLVGFDILNGLSQIVGSGLESAGQAQGLLGGQFISLLGTATKGAPGLGILLSILNDAVPQGWNSINDIDFLKSMATKGLSGTVSDAVEALLRGIGAGRGTVMADYLALGGIDGSTRWTTEGAFTGTGEGTSTSGSITNQEQPTTALEIKQEEDSNAHNFEDLYRLLAEDYPTTTFSTVANIPHETNNCVMVGSPETTQYIVDMLTITAVSTENILMLLENAFAGGTRTLIDMSALNVQNMWGDWSGTSTANP